MGQPPADRASRLLGYKSRLTLVRTIDNQNKHVMTHLPEPITNLRSPSRDRRLIGEELETLRSEIKAGEPQPQEITLRSRLGLFMKRRLYRLLWWHVRQFNAFVDLTSRWVAEEGRAIDDVLKKLENAEKIQSADTSRLFERISQISYELQSESSQREHLTARLSQLAKKVEAEIPQQLSALALKVETDTQQQLSALTQKIEAEISQQLSALALKFEADTQQHVSALSHTFAADIQQHVSALSHTFAADVQQHVSALEQKIEAETKPLATRLSNLGLLTNQAKDSLSIQDRRLTVFIEEARKRLPEPLPRDTLIRMADDQTQHKYDSLYAAFEDVFRGSREDIKGRQAVYLPILNESSIGSPSMPLLDLGCGRGEWLELLNEHGLHARGIDSNEIMIERCRSFGLQVELADSIAILETLPDASLGAVTAFHMVEHMPFEVVLKLVDEVLRVLKPGGLIILETPNPVNLLVGAYTFHLDPTHLKPLPSPMLRFFVEGRGFCDVHVRELHPYPEALQFPDDNGGIASRLNNYLYGPQDYSVIGRKP